MAPKLILASLVIFLSLLFKSTLAKHNSQTINYIESSCNGTLYPDLCIRCLNKFSKSTINGPQHLAHVALFASLSRALQTRGYLLNAAKELKAIDHNNKRMYLTVQDCVNQMNDSVDQLSQAIKELKRLNKFNTIINDKVLWHISNVETWVSTALTDASSCVQSFPGHRMSKRVATIKVKAKNVAEVTSNALALFQSYATRYRQEAARTSKKP
ncbi:putative pectinesterase [Medicago truncatula]|uniref:Plant invertase/pectin methylesterase inhibitor n=1 Tax=Medicago truncatula TaxID=3880 RepID=A0A072UJ34_MEDTR|nr:pectinesterase inhibitor 9 [Medicago truncatula]KEH29118.1 plant invertase/pectin methylesterase inhibitor [Medicago truncatula]RHN59299.1 putative pectinesterase [Medicago truncatula]